MARSPLGTPQQYCCLWAPVAVTMSWSSTGKCSARLPRRESSPGATKSELGTFRKLIFASRMVHCHAWTGRIGHTLLSGGTAVPFRTIISRSSLCNSDFKPSTAKDGSDSSTLPRSSRQAFAPRLPPKALASPGEGSKPGSTRSTNSAELARTAVFRSKVAGYLCKCPVRFPAKTIDTTVLACGLRRDSQVSARCLAVLGLMSPAQMAIETTPGQVRPPNAQQWHPRPTERERLSSCSSLKAGSPQGTCNCNFVRSIVGLCHLETTMPVKHLSSKQEPRIAASAPLKIFKTRSCYPCRVGQKLRGQSRNELHIFAEGA